ncbi:MAG: DUF1844 domain-containing protein [Planctomycetes bacterium]|nr:DUF1844 domain-containing protein [Planctomycetota bacterium]MBI3832966.1 DUF1844 domain-containing protein [Planctomycetota bacterium]
MSDESPSKIHIDSDWKQEAAKEKERLAVEERKLTPEGEPPADFVELLNLLALQAAVALGGYQSPTGERLPPNPMAAKHYIDLLSVLDKKTAGNLTEEEKKILEGVLYELRMQYVAAMGGARQAPKAS